MITYDSDDLAYAEQESVRLHQENRSLLCSPTLRAESKADLLAREARQIGAVIHRRDSRALAVFFEANPLWTAAQILRLRERCAMLGKPRKTWDPMWHAKHGKTIKFLLINLAKILRDLNCTGEFPPLQAVSATVLYAARVPRAIRRALVAKDASAPSYKSASERDVKARLPNA